MNEPPVLSEIRVLSAIKRHYGLRVAELTFLPLGSDTASSAYRVVDSNGTTYFLKARNQSGFVPASVSVPRFLRDSGIDLIVAPISTSAGELWIDVEGFALSMFTFIDGRIGANASLSEKHWRTLGETVKHLHSAKLPPDLQSAMPQECFTPSRRSVSEDLEAAVLDTTLTDPFQREWTSLWQSRRDTIHEVVDQADKLGKEIAKALLPQVLCHGDLHPWNLLLDSMQQPWLVDWDETVLAPKERDLMFVIGGIGGDGVTADSSAWFLEGYGAVTMNLKALAYYRSAWAVQDIAAFGEWVFFIPELDEKSRSKAVQIFHKMFSPGNIIELALSSRI